MMRRDPDGSFKACFRALWQLVGARSRYAGLRADNASASSDNCFVVRVLKLYLSPSVFRSVPVRPRLSSLDRRFFVDSLLVSVPSTPVNFFRLALASLLLFIFGFGFDIFSCFLDSQ